MTYSCADFTDDILAALDIKLTTDRERQDPEVQAGYARAEIERLRAVELGQAAVRAALQQWKCPGCGGSGVYQQNAAGRARDTARGRTPDPRFQPDPVTCKVCNGDGLNPIASAALKPKTKGDQT